MHIELGYRIRILRELRNVSQFQLEIDAKLAPGMLSRIENGRVSPTKETLWRISLALKLSMPECIYLFGLESVSTKPKGRKEQQVVAGLRRYVGGFLPDQHQMFDHIG